MNRTYGILGIALASLSILVPSLPVAASGLFSAPRIHVRETQSLNWSGYAVETNLQNPANNAVTDVQGTWVVPTVTGPRKGSYYSADWVGIDGYSGPSVEQIGTDSDWVNGRPSYYAWYEMYPQAGYLITGITVRPGDTMSANVSYSGNSFTLFIEDVTNGGTFTLTQQNTTAQRSSAEWVVEAPSSYSGRVLPLADFGTVTFSAASATINGHTGNIGDTAWRNDPMIMVTQTGIVKAQPTALSNGGTSFTVTWYHN